MPRPGTCSAVAMTADLPGLWISRIVPSNRNAARSHNAHQQPCRTPARASKNDLDLPGRHILPSPASPHVVQPAGPVHPRTRASTVWMTVEAVCSEPVSARFPDNGKYTGKFPLSTLLLCKNMRVSYCIFCAYIVFINRSAIHNRELSGNSSIPVELAFVVQNRWRAGDGRVQPVGLIQGPRTPFVNILSTCDPALGIEAGVPHRMDIGP